MVHDAEDQIHLDIHISGKVYDTQAKKCVHLEVDP